MPWANPGDYLERSTDRVLQTSGAAAVAEEVELFEALLDDPEQDDPEETLAQVLDQMVTEFDRAITFYTQARDDAMRRREEQL